MRARRILMVFLIISVLAISMPQLGYSHDQTSNTQNGDTGNSSLDTTTPNNQLASDPSASPRPVNESAIGFDAGTGSGRAVNLPSTSANDLPVTFDYGWVGNKLYTTVTGLWDQKDWSNNGNFTSSSSGWTFWPHNVGTYNNPISGQWANTGATGGTPGYVYAEIDGVYSGGFYRYDAGDAMAWNQTVNIPRGTVISAKLEFKYYIVSVPMLDTLGANIYGWVGRGFAFQISYPSIPTPYNSWHYVSVDVPLSNITLPNVLISLGHYQIGSYGYSSLNYVRVYFDNVRLTVKALVKPEQVNLKLAAPGSPNINCSIVSPSPSTYGAGSGTLTGFTIGPAPLQTTYYFDFISNVSSPTTGSFMANATIYVNRQKTAPATFVNQGDFINWSVSLVTAFQLSGQSFGTTSYTKYYFNVSVPKDWSLTGCTDPNGVNHDIKTDPNISNKTIGTVNIIKVNVTGIGSYSIPPNYYPYVIHANSSNYVKSLWTQLKTGSSTYVNSTNFHPQNYTRFASYIAGASPVSSGVANLTIRGPPTYNASPIVLKTIKGNVPSNGWANFTVLWNATYVAGNYSAQVDWVDNALGEAGSLTCYFNITHKLRPVIAIPAAGDVLLKGTIMLDPPTTVRVVDYYTNETVTANVTGRVAWDYAGKWDKFTYSSSIYAYINYTRIWSSLTVGAEYWIAANATKLYYDKGTANNTFWIGSGAYIDPKLDSVSIFYTEKSPFLINLPQIAYKENGTNNPITNATFDILAEGSSNNSIIHWDNAFRFQKNLTLQSQGKYFGTIDVGAISQSLKAIPASATNYYVYYRLRQGNYYQTRYFTFILTVAEAPNYLKISSGDGQYIFWGGIAQVKLNYTTYWTFGGRSLPRTPIQNSSSSWPYAPPYVQVICGWGGSWTANHSALDPAGIYTLYIDTSSWATPTDDGSGAGTATFSVRFNKQSYLAQPGGDENLVSLTLHIKRLTTSITGAVSGAGGALTLTNTTSVYSGDLKTIFVWYNDTHLVPPGLPIGVGSASVTYTSSGGNILGSGAFVPVPGRSGLYNLTLTGTLTGQTPGLYYLYISASKEPYYVARTMTLNITILAIPSNLEAVSASQTIYYLDRVTYLIWFNDIHNSLPISGALISVSVPYGLNVYTPTEVPGSPGLYNLTVPAGNAIGSYIINLTATKSRYATGVESISLHVNRLPTAFVSYIVASDGSILVQPNATVAQGGTVTIYLWFNDTHNNSPISGVERSITYASGKFGSGWVQPVTGVLGLYSITFNALDAGLFPIDFTANATNYEVQTFTFTINSQAPPPGFNLATLMLVGFGGGGIVVVGVAAWLLVRRARIPFIIKKIDETLKLINKGEHEQATPAPLKSREESIVGIVQERIEAFSKRKAAPGAAEAAPVGKAVEEAAAVASTAEVEATLKKELKAVEAAKPEEQIEEVEMETLDEELGRLEQEDTGKEVPEGAKQARDVIDEYKKRKKKR